jgi:hypothetical protein
VLRPHLTAENAAAVLKRAAHRTTSQIEELLAELAPRPDVPAVIRKRPAAPASVSEKLERLERKRFGLTKSPRKKSLPEDEPTTDRYRPSATFGRVAMAQHRAARVGSKQGSG